VKIASYQYFVACSTEIKFFFARVLGLAAYLASQNFYINVQVGCCLPKRATPRFAK
jgi:hypothetical protein